MESLLFSDRSLWTMVHGIVLGGAALMAMAAALFSLRAMPSEGTGEGVSSRQARYLAWLIVFAAVATWLTVLIGTYITFPPYRAVPPEGLADLDRFPKSLIQSNPNTAWLHSFAMEVKEHVPWIAAMLLTAVALVAVRYRSQLLNDRELNRMASALLLICVVLVAFVALLGVFINKVAPLE
jgi:hypothetical protein